MTKQRYTIVVIDDDALVNATITSVLEEQYESVRAFTDCAEALEELETFTPDLILLDVFLGSYNGLDVLELLHDRGMKCPIIMITAYSDVKMAVRAVKLGAEDFIVKPLDLEQLELAIERALRHYELRRKVDVLSEQVSRNSNTEILGESVALKETLRIAEIVAKADDTTALITGESGTGKELIARYIHQRSPRSKNSFITVNCGAIPKELAENELFGYEKGAFTGATEKVKQGRFEMAHRGTILLDEVGELSLELQVKLLRALQERKFYRLGGTKEVSVDVRVIAATNQDLEQLVEEGKFRQDLFYRLNVARLELPPLRERQADILPLATAFLQEFSKKFGRKIMGFSPEVADALQSYEWKGNIRELRNVIERVALLASGEIIGKDAVKFLRGTSGKSSKVSVEDKETPPDGHHSLKISRSAASYNAVVRDLIVQTLKLTEGNQIKAAKLLGISRAKLRYRIEQLGITLSIRTPEE